jgi:hypothetical protein
LAGGKNLEFQSSTHATDFILENADCLTDNDNLFSQKIEPFDIIVSNPPYFKLAIDDERVIAAKPLLTGILIFMPFLCRQVLHQFVQVRIVDYNPDNPKLPVNSPNVH